LEDDVTMCDYCGATGHDWTHHMEARRDVVAYQRSLEDGSKVPAVWLEVLEGDEPLSPLQAREVNAWLRD
jgi:hypothetical protein